MRGKRRPYRKSVRVRDERAVCIPQEYAIDYQEGIANP